MMLLTLLATAFAGSFTVSDTPATMEFEYSYVKPIALTDDAEFTFTDTFHDTSTELCDDTGLCMNGMFQTDDSGVGGFNTTAYVDESSCSSTSPPGSPSLFEVVTFDCDIYQEVDLTFVFKNGATSVRYTGEALAGTEDRASVYYCPSGVCSLVMDFTYGHTLSSGSFSGDLGGIGAGTWTEI